jgi:teichuronic acid biosynthesis glycosyltransferase TuaG
MKKVSVIMASYNAEPFIRKSIESVTGQTYQNIELIIVDDASTDNSLLIAREASVKDKRIKVFALEKNIGAGNARNYAISKAEGEWLAILDADDIFLPEKIELQINKIAKSGSDIILVGTDSFEINYEGKRFSIQKYPSDNKTLKYNLIRQKRFPPHSSLMYNADSFNRIRGFDNRLCPCEDYNLWLHLTDLGSFASVPVPLVEYRHHLSNISKANSGFEQLKFSFAGAVCYYLRNKGFHDPTDQEYKSDWLKFINWLVIQLEQEDILSYRHRKEVYRNNYFSKTNVLDGIAKLSGTMLVDPEFILKFFREKLFGNNLPERYAEKWIKEVGSIEKY